MTESHSMNITVVPPLIRRIFRQTRRTERAAAKAYFPYVEPSESRSNDV